MYRHKRESRADLWNLLKGIALGLFAGAIVFASLGALAYLASGMSESQSTANVTHEH